MDGLTALAFFSIMLTLAALPGASVALVVTRAATHGTKSGLAVAVGIVLGDLLFIALALLGMSFLAETMGALFSIVKYLGGAYLIWLGLTLLRSKDSQLEQARDSQGSSLLTSGVAGLLLTLGDFKAILFYASLLPSLVDVRSLSIQDVALIAGVTILTVGGVKSAYAITARRLVEMLSATASSRHFRTVAGGVLMGTGTYLIARS
jgi:threonine/homoserine/homoserine lactone efflux protein